jgi:hypothetical protein
MEVKKVYKTMIIITAFSMLFLLWIRDVNSWDNTPPLIVDHQCTGISTVPPEWIDSVQTNVRWHYAHTSHGLQLATGLFRIEEQNSVYSFAYENNTLPDEPGALCTFNGQESDTYITPDMYWRTVSGMNSTRDVLNHNEAINVSMWAWCSELDGYSETDVQAYLDSLSRLESEYPDVVFIYVTGNAQATGAEGYNRHLRNEQIRRFCFDNNKILYDFADLDCWWYNPSAMEWEYSSYLYGEHTVPIQHPQFNGDESGHTTFESCEQKGAAVWWMLARMAGWQSDTTHVHTDSWSGIKGVFRE